MGWGLKQVPIKERRKNKKDEEKCGGSGEIFGLKKEHTFGIIEQIEHTFLNS
ncbi:hypothetical protein [Paenibacillus sp. TH7-28]